jgi:hypothetical protein
VGRGMVLRIYTIGGAPESRPVHARSKPKRKPAAPRAVGTSGGAAAATHN